MRISNNHLIYSSVILVLAKHSVKMKQNVGIFFDLQYSSTDDHFIDLRFKILDLKKEISNYSRIHNYLEVDIPNLRFTLHVCNTEYFISHV